MTERIGLAEKMLGLPGVVVLDVEELDPVTVADRIIVAMDAAITPGQAR